MARGLSESLKETMGSTIADLFISCFVLCYLLVLGFVYISNLFILENIDADGQGFCQGGFSIDFTKVSSHFRQIQIFFTDSTGFKNTRSLLQRLYNYHVLMKIVMKPSVHFAIL